MRIDANSNKTAFAMIILGALTAASTIGSLVVSLYFLLLGITPTLGLLFFFVWTIIIDVATWRLDAHLYPKTEKKEKTHEKTKPF